MKLWALVGKSTRAECAVVDLFYDQVIQSTNIREGV